MSRILELPDPLYAALERAAAASGTTLQGWIASHLPEVKEEEKASTPRTLADLFAGRVGGIRSGSKEALSEECGQKFAEHLRQKQQQGHL